MTFVLSRAALVSLALVNVAAAFAVGCSDPITLPKQGDLPGLAPDGGADAAMTTDADPPPPVPPVDSGAADVGSIPVDAAAPSDSGSVVDAASSGDAAVPVDAGASAPAGEPSAASCPATTPTLLAESSSNIWDMAMGTDRLYWTTTEGTGVIDHGVLFSLPKAGGVPATRMTETHDASYRGLDVSGDTVFYTYAFHTALGAMDNAIASIAGNSSGGTGTVLATRAAGLVAPSEVRVVGNRVYFSDQGNGGNWTYGVRSIPTAGGATQFEVDTSSSNGATTMPYVDTTGFWFGSFPSAGGLNQPGSVYHADIGTTTPTVIDSTGVNTTPTAFAQDGTSVFWTEFVPNWPGNPGYPFVNNAGRLMVKTGNAPASELAVAQHGTGLTLDPQKTTLYFAISFTHGIGNPDVAIVKMPKGGGVVTPIVCGLQFFPRRLYADNTHVYFADNPSSGTNRVYRVAR